MNRIPQLLYAPYGDNAGGASPMTFDVPEVAPATANATIETVELPPSPAEQVGPKIIGPKELLGDDGTEEMERMEAASEGRPVRERGPDGKFLPKKPKGDDATPAPKAEAKPVAPKAAPKPKPAAKAPEAPKAPEPPAKIKLGDTEKTAEEWAQEFADLKSKAETAAKPPEPAKEPPKPEEVQAEQQQRAQDFISRAAEQYKMKPEELDDILAGGEKAVGAFANSLARVEANTRQWAANEFNQIVKQISDKITPLVEHHSQIADYQRDNSFLESNPEIKAHPQGYQTYRDTRALLEKGYADIQAEIKAGTATPVRKAWATIFESQTPEQFNANVAEHTKAELAKIPAPVAPKPPVQPAVAKSPNATKPFNGDRPGGASATPAAESSAARALREMTESGR